MMKKNWSKILAAVLVISVIACLLAGCSDGKPSDDVIQIGVVQLVKHEALDKAYEGFVEELAAQGYSEKIGNIKIDYQVATGKADECATIANQFVSDGKDLILAIATPAAQAAVNATSEIPVIVTAVTNPKGDCPGDNVTGTSDLGPIEAQIKFAKELSPSLKKMGILYNSSEANSKFQAERAKKAAKAEGIEYKEYTVTAPTELQSVVESMKGEVDVCWIPTDNTCASNMPTIKDAASSAGVMTICSESGMVNKGGLVTCGAVDYLKLGKQTGSIAVEVIKGAAPSSVEIGFQDAGENPEVIINTDVAKEFNIPSSVFDKATKITTITEK